MKNIALRKNTNIILEKYHLRPYKKYGQNFMVSPSVIARIVNEAQLTKETAVIEVGPGIGALTEALAAKSNHVYAYEIDERMRDIITHEVEFNNVTVFIEDFLKADLAGLLREIPEADIAVVTNLPYYITTKVLRKLMIEEGQYRVIALLQKEVAQKMCGEEKNALSNMIDHAGHIEYCFEVKRDAFMPEPHVDSAVVRILKQKNCPQELIDLLDQAFRQRRKTLHNNLKPLFDKDTDDILLKCGIMPNERAEQLTIADFERIIAERRSRG